MPANMVLAANRINADVAGKTRKAADDVKTDVGKTAEETVFGGESIGHMLSGGVHPEHIVQDLVQNTDLPKASDSLKGALGGLIPRRGSTLQAGPAGSINAAKGVANAGR